MENLQKSERKHLKKIIYYNVLCFLIFLIISFISFIIFAKKITIFLTYQNLYQLEYIKN